MMRSARKYVCAVVTLLAAIGIAMPRAASAQGTDFAVGYSYLHENDLSENFPKGWFASAGGNVNSWLAFAGEAAGNYKTFSGPDSSSKISLRIHTFAAGPRFVSHSGQVHFFGQVLFGVAHLSVGSNIQDFGGDSTTKFEWQPGVGVDWDFKKNTGLRIGANERFIRAEGENFKEFQFIAGIVFRR